MPVQCHSLEFIGTTPSNYDRLSTAFKTGVANVAGGGAGAAVATVVTFSEALPASYVPVVHPGQAAVWWISAKTAFGFTVNQKPQDNTVTLAAGTFDVILFA